MNLPEYGDGLKLHTPYVLWAPVLTNGYSIQSISVAFEYPYSVFHFPYHIEMPYGKWSMKYGYSNATEIDCTKLTSKMVVGVNNIHCDFNIIF